MNTMLSRGMICPYGLVPKVWMPGANQNVVPGLFARTIAAASLPGAMGTESGGADGGPSRIDLLSHIRAGGV